LEEILSSEEICIKEKMSGTFALLHRDGPCFAIIHDGVLKLPEIMVTMGRFTDPEKALSANVKTDGGTQKVELGVLLTDEEKEVPEIFSNFAALNITTASVHVMLSNVAFRSEENFRIFDFGLVQSEILDFKENVITFKTCTQTDTFEFKIPRNIQSLPLQRQFEDYV
jgi:hypothetical protein